MATDALIDTGGTLEFLREADLYDSLTQRHTAILERADRHVKNAGFTLPVICSFYR
jgi:hypothetical protein